MIGLAFFPRVIAVVAVAVLSACTSRVGGVPTGVTTLPDEPEQQTAELVFDDLTTVAPCSLTDPEVFSSFGDAEFGTPESLDYCAISVKTSSGAEVVISVGSFGELAAQPELEAHRLDDYEGGLWVGQQDDSPSFCSQQLVFPDDVTMQVQGSVYDGDADTCPMVEAGMAHAIEVIQDEGVEHREPAGNSLVTVDPCSLIDDSDVRAIPGLEAAEQPHEYPGRHTCFWEVGASADITVRLQFGAGPEPAAFGTGANEDPVAGRPSATNPYPEVGEASYCSVETAHIEFDEVDGEDAFEVASVFVRMPAAQVQQGCTAARAVAELVWPELPEA